MRGVPQSGGGDPVFFSGWGGGGGPPGGENARGGGARRQVWCGPARELPPAGAPRTEPPSEAAERSPRPLDVPPASSKPSGSWTVLVDKRRGPLPSFSLPKASRGRHLFPL